MYGAQRERVAAHVRGVKRDCDVVDSIAGEEKVEEGVRAASTRR